jgi:predicted hotdog family 3-hydroxylacyl-ACP dehydratase
MASSEEINIPQKPPMVMVDRLIGIDGKTTVTALIIRADNVFCENGAFREPGLIENMAQTAAAGAGAQPEMAGKEARVGFIGGIRNLKIMEFPVTGQEIITKATVINEVFDATIVLGEVFLDSRLIASCELKIFLVKS